MKEEPHHKHLQPRHADHDQILDNAEPPDPRLCAPHRAEIAILARAKVLLVACDCAQLAGDLVDALLQQTRLLGGGALLCGQRRGAGFVLDGDFKVDQFVREGGHVVVEAEGVGAGGFRGGEDVVALLLSLAVEHYPVAWGKDGVVDVEGAAGLDLLSAVSRGTQLGWGVPEGED